MWILKKKGKAKKLLEPCVSWYGRWPKVDVVTTMWKKKLCLKVKYMSKVATLWWWDNPAYACRVSLATRAFFVFFVLFWAQVSVIFFVLLSLSRVRHFPYSWTLFVLFFCCIFFFSFRGIIVFRLIDPLFHFDFELSRNVKMPHSFAYLMRWKEFGSNVDH